MLSPGKPRHEQISDWIRSRIASGELAVDHQLPSESQLGKQFSVSRITIRRALHTLESEDLIYRRQGLGSFVKGAAVEQGLVRLTDFVEDMRQSGLVATSKVIGTVTELAKGEIATALDISPKTVVARLDRLRLGDGEPLAFDHTWLPLNFWHYIEGHDLGHRSIYSILEEDFGIPILRGTFRISAVDAPAAIANHLNIPKRRAVLLIERTSFTESGRRVYYQQRYYRSDRVAYKLELERLTGSTSSTGSGMPLQDFEPVFTNR